MTRADRPRVGVVLAAVVTLVVAGCATPGPDIAREPVPVAATLAHVDTSTLQMPVAYDGLDVVDPGWDTAAQFADGVYLGAGERDGVLEFTAVDIYGDVLWSARRPANCTGFAVTTDAQGRALAILGDAQAGDDANAGASASAYDLHTGGLVWGPVDVPGPLVGPGLVFGASSVGGTGEPGPRVVLDGTNGRVAATEGGPDEVRVVGERDGLVLLADEEALVGVGAADGQERWRLPLAAQGWDAQALRAVLAPAPGLMLIETGGSAGALIDVYAGAVVSATARDAAVDTVTGTLAVLDDAGLHGFDPSGEPLWSLTVGGDATIAALGGALLYLREGDSIRVHNVLTGAVAQGYAPDGQGPIVVPTHIGPQGAGLLLDAQRLLMATVSQHPSGEVPPQ